MVSGADVRQALQAGLCKALEDGSGRAAVRATCRDARDMADELQDSAVLPVGWDTWGSGAAIAVYHRKLGAVRSLHVRYSCGEADDARAAQFVQAYSAALGAAMPVNRCTITMSTAAGTQLCLSFAAALLARVVPRVERLDMALGSYGNLTQLLTLLQPCTHLRCLRLLPAAEEACEPEAVRVWLDTDHVEGSVLEALCRLTRLHTLSGPWMITGGVLNRLCAALPSLTTLGFWWLDLFGASGACISRQLHTLAGWRHRARGDARSQPASHPWHLLDRSASRITNLRNLQSLLPAVQQLEWVVLDAAYHSISVELPAVVAAAPRFAACAERWACKVAFHYEEEWADGLEVGQRLVQGSLASVKHAVVEVGEMICTDAASCLRSLVAAAPSITTLAVSCDFCDDSPEELAEKLEPLRRAACMHSLRLAEAAGSTMRAGGTALSLAQAVRGLVRPNAEGECCSALKRVRLAGVEPGALHVCRLALADDGVDVSVEERPYKYSSDESS